MRVNAQIARGKRLRQDNGMRWIIAHTNLALDDGLELGIVDYRDLGLPKGMSLVTNDCTSRCGGNSLPDKSELCLLTTSPSSVLDFLGLVPVESDAEFSNDLLKS